jgi:1-acyl-sn-glycerol-3-phosphate acyltransferase
MYFLRILTFIVFTILIAVMGSILLLLFYPLRTGLGPLLLQFASKICLFIFGVEVDRADHIDFKALRNRSPIIISNHVTFLDIFLLSALYRTVYVSKIEVKYYPFIGQAASLMGIVFLDRSSKESRTRIVNTIADKPREIVLTLFPQGTTSSLGHPMPFRPGVFRTIHLNADIVLIPLTIHYKHDREIAWTRDQMLFDNIKKVGGLKRIPVRVKVHEPITVQDYGNHTVEAICEETQNKVLKELWA